jgi:hypothetical protein
MNPLCELRARLNLSRVQFGKLVNKSEATIEKYEAEVSQEFAARLAKLAIKHGYGDLEMLFNIAAGKEPDRKKLDLATISSDEFAFLESCLSLYRNPRNDYERSVITIVRELIKLRRRKK